MSRYTGPSCRLCRREGTKLFLKGTALPHREVRRSSAGRIRRASTARRPAAAARRRSTPSSCVRSRRSSGSTASPSASSATPSTGSPASRASRAPTCWSRSRPGSTTSSTGWASPPAARRARQLVRHGHVEVNGGKVDVPSLPGAAGPGSAGGPGEPRDGAGASAALEFASRGAPMSWLTVDCATRPRASSPSAPTRDAIPLNAQEQLIVELYSKWTHDH